MCIRDRIETKSKGTRIKAAALAARWRDPILIDRLIESLARKMGRSGGGQMSLNASVSRVPRFDTYEQKFKVRGANGVKTFKQTIKMPVISGVNISTTMAVPPAHALMEITGERFGNNVAKWQAWRKGHPGAAAYP